MEYRNKFRGESSKLQIGDKTEANEEKCARKVKSEAMRSGFEKDLSKVK